MTNQKQIKEFSQSFADKLYTKLSKKTPSIYAIKDMVRDMLTHKLESERWEKNEN